MAITLTESAAAHVLRCCEERGGAAGVRLAVKPSGCSGLAYVLEYADKVESGDLAFESHGARLIVDAKSLPHIDGTELDYVREGLQEGFRFNNPNVKDACGCGASFTT